MPLKKVDPPIQLGQAVVLVSSLGGYLGRNNDPPPGNPTMWKGYTNLQLLCDGYLLAKSIDSG